MAGEEKVLLKLGLDLGPSSIGWALLRPNTETIGEIVAGGTHVFDAGLDDLSIDGKGKSRNVARREARGRRRMLERAARRLVKLAHILQGTGLLPEGDVTDPQNRHEFFTRLDQEMQTSPYVLRSGALEEQLAPFELGRALYHLAQRRGFKSNRLETAKSAEEDTKGAVKGGISSLRDKMTEAGTSTLGQYFAQLDPRQDGQRIRKRYTARDMYESEFDKIWEAQRAYNPEVLTRKLRKQIHRAIYFQRPLKSVSRYIGKCELHPDQKRAPMALYISQRFRYLQTINNVEVEDHGTGEIRALTQQERSTLIAELETKSEVKFPTVRKLLGLGKTVKFNLERGGEDRILGNKTAARLREIFGHERWQTMSRQEQDAVVEDIRSIIKEQTLAKRGRKRWGLDDEQAVRFGKIGLESGYCAYSRQALAVLLPELEKGTRLQTIIKDKFPDRFAHQGEAVLSLPPFRKSGLTQLRNPIVERTLTELRRVVNLVIGKYSRPDVIHIELARDLRQSAKQREQSTKRMRANQKARAAAEQMLKDVGIELPSRADILKVLLRNECKGDCPYTGKPISIGSLFGPSPDFDIEHIIPFDRCLDNSFMNLTLCDVHENRNVKRNRTPAEAYAADEEKWDAMQHRVKQFQGDAAREKLRRFRLCGQELEDEIAAFSSRQLNDTRWASKLAKQYVGMLYGGVQDHGVDNNGKLRVIATSGSITSFLRGQWGLNKILSVDDKKSRDDHRHHAVDAIVIALADTGTVKQLNDAAKRASTGLRHRLFDDFPQPWEGFHADVEEVIKEIKVSHRVDKRVRGALHKETFYGKPRKDKVGKEYVHTRVPLESLSAKDMDHIIDCAVRLIVMEHFQKHGNDIKKAFGSVENHPVMPGTGYSIHRVRIRQNLATIAIGEGPRTRHVGYLPNHHMEVAVEVDASGKEVGWAWRVKSMLEAYQRRKLGLPVVDREFGEGHRFLFSLANGEVVVLDSEGRSSGLFVVRTIEKSNGNVRFAPLNDARTLDKMGKKGLTAMPNVLRQKHCRKVTVTPLGEVLYPDE